MALKRKRSGIAIPTLPDSSATSPGTQYCSPTSLPFFYGQSKPVEPLRPDTSWAWKQSGDAESRHSNSRTLKRHRDNRGDEQEVYAYTVHKLFNAQQQHPNASPQPSHSASAPTQPSAPVQQQPQRSTSHSFWHLPPPPSHPIQQASAPAPIPNVRCEDCEGAIRSDDAMDVDDGMLEETSACVNCGRRVCGFCAVVGDTRRCLGCATSGM